MSGLPWHVTLIKRLLEAFPTRIVGLKDSSGDMAYARVGRGDRARLRRVPVDGGRAARGARRAISPAASRPPPISTPICARAPGGAATRPRSTPRWRSASCSTASRLVSGVKALLGHIHGDPALARVKPPLAAFSAADSAAVICRPRCGQGQTGGITRGFVGVDACLGPDYKPRPWRRSILPPRFLAKISRLGGLSAAKRQL